MTENSVYILYNIIWTHNSDRRHVFGGTNTAL